MNRFFVTGTDTGVGKTFVTCTLARRARAKGRRVFAFKPIETGCPLVGGERLGEDQAALVEAAGSWQTDELVGVYRFERPVAPSVAAAAENQTIELAPIARALERGSVEADLVLVEGAGGWRVPITDDLEMRDLAKLVGGPVIVVGRAGLGTINHCLLTVEAIERDGLEVGLVVLSDRPGDNEELTFSNVGELRKRWSGRVEVLSRLIW